MEIFLIRIFLCGGEYTVSAAKFKVFAEHPLPYVIFALDIRKENKMGKIFFRDKKRSGFFLILGLLVTIAVVSILTGSALRQTAPATPSAAARAAVANRAPARIIKDRFPAYAAVAVDTAHNEVVLAAENILSLMTHDRTQNTPPQARSEPRRIINGLNTELEFVCGVHVDPMSGDVYAINNDTLNKLTVFSRRANGA